MITPVIEYFITGVSDELVSDIIRYTEVGEYKKEEFILRSGKISNHTSWILKGLVRSYYTWLPTSG